MQQPTKKSRTAAQGRGEDSSIVAVLAKTSLRLRQHRDLRNSENDNSQRILNALEPGTVLPIHRHPESSETVVMLRGKGRWNYYDDNGNQTDSFLVSADGDIRGISVPKGQWHNTECLESGTVILECKDGKWRPLAEDDFLPDREGQITDKN